MTTTTGVRAGATPGTTPSTVLAPQAPRNATTATATATRTATAAATTAATAATNAAQAPNATISVTVQPRETNAQRLLNSDFGKNSVWNYGKTMKAVTYIESTCLGGAYLPQIIVGFVASIFESAYNLLRLVGSTFARPVTKIGPYADPADKVARDNFVSALVKVQGLTSPGPNAQVDGVKLTAAHNELDKAAAEIVKQHINLESEDVAQALASLSGAQAALTQYQEIANLRMPEGSRFVRRPLIEVGKRILTETAHDQVCQIAANNVKKVLEQPLTASGLKSVADFNNSIAQIIALVPTLGQGTDNKAKELIKSTCATVIGDAVAKYNAFADHNERQRIEAQLSQELTTSVAAQRALLEGNGTPENLGLIAVTNALRTKKVALETEITTLSQGTLTLGAIANAAGSVPAAQQEIVNQIIAKRTELANVESELAVKNQSRQTAETTLANDTRRLGNVSAGLTELLNARKALIIFANPGLTNQLRNPASTVVPTPGAAAPRTGTATGTVLTQLVNAAAQGTSPATTPAATNLATAPAAPGTGGVVSVLANLQNLPEPKRGCLGWGWTIGGYGL